MPRKPDPVMTVRDIAAHLNVDEKTIYRLAQHRDFPSFKVAGVWRFQREDLQRWIDQRKRLPVASKASRKLTKR